MSKAFFSFFKNITIFNGIFIISFAIINYLLILNLKTIIITKKLLNSKNNTFKNIFKKIVNSLIDSSYNILAINKEI